MIPTMILFGLAFGWWWKFTLIAAPLTWVTLLVVGGTIDWSWPPEWIIGTVLGGALFGLLNAGVGAIVPQVARLIRYLIRRNSTAKSAAPVRY